MIDENLTFYEPDEHQLSKFHRINSLSYDDWELRCVSCNDCSICPIPTAGRTNMPLLPRVP